MMRGRLHIEFDNKKKVVIDLSQCPDITHLTEFYEPYLIKKFTHNNRDLHLEGMATVAVEYPDGVVSGTKLTCLVCINHVTVSIFAQHPVNWRKIPRLHDTTRKLVSNLNEALNEKLLVSQIKLGLTEGWAVLPEGKEHEIGKTFSNEHELNVALAKHLEKGDLLDSIIYLAFMRELGYKVNLECRVPEKCR